PLPTRPPMSAVAMLPPPMKDMFIVVLLWLRGKEVRKGGGEVRSAGAPRPTSRPPPLLTLLRQIFPSPRAPRWNLRQSPLQDPPTCPSTAYRRQDPHRGSGRSTRATRETARAAARRPRSARESP